MNDLSPQVPDRPLIWTDFIYYLQDLLSDIDVPIYIIGGAVRDAFLHRPIKDIDLTVPTRAIKIARRIANRLKGDIFVMDQERGVARVFVQFDDIAIIIDVADFRQDGLYADLLDRDFTINAMAVDLHHNLTEVIDPLDGLSDLQAKRLRRCSENSLANDPIRSLRAVRQSVQLKLKIEPNTLQDIRHCAGILGQVSPERLRDELFNIFRLTDLTQALRIADTVGLLPVIFPEIEMLKDMESLPPHIFKVWQHTLYVIDHLQKILTAISFNRTDHTAASFGLGMLIIQLDKYRSQLQEHIIQQGTLNHSRQSMLLWTAFFHDFGKMSVQGDNPHINQTIELVNIYAEKLRLSNSEKLYLKKVIGHYRKFFELDELTPLVIHRFWYEVDALGIDACLLALADYLGTVGNELQQSEWLILVKRARRLIEAFFDEYDVLIRPYILMNGTNLIEELHLKSSPLIGDILVQIREAQVSGHIQTYEDALSLAKKLVDP